MPTPFMSRTSWDREVCALSGIHVSRYSSSVYICRTSSCVFTGTGQNLLVTVIIIHMHTSGFHECGLPSPHLSTWTVLVWFWWYNCFSPAWCMSQNLLNSAEGLPAMLWLLIHGCSLHPNCFFLLPQQQTLIFPCRLPTFVSSYSLIFPVTFR